MVFFYVFSRYRYDMIKKIVIKRKVLRGNMKKHLALKIGIGTLIALLLGSGGVFAYFAHYYSNVFFHGTSINGMDVSGMTVDEVEKKIAESVDSYTLTVKFRGDGKEEITDKAIGYRYQPDGTVQKLKEKQNSLNWLDGYLHKTTQKVNVKMTYSVEALIDVVSAMPELQDDKMEEPKDAFMEFKDTKFRIVPEIQGTKITGKDRVLAAIEEAVKAEEKELDLEKEIPDLYAKPKKLSDDKAMNEEMKQLNELVSACVTYDLPGGEKKTLDGTTLKDWLTKDKEGKYKLDETEWTKHLTDYVAEMAASVDTYDRDREFEATGIGKVKVHNMTYGYLIDQAGEIEQLRKDIKSGEAVERKPVYSNWQTSDENNGYGDTYVEIDCTRQHLWLYENGKVAVETDIVSGAMSGDTITPTGVYMFVTKESPSLLVGRDSNNKVMYRQPVKYFMPFIGMGIGIHDATWQAAFGGTRYRDGFGSHGCINVPLDKAEQLYNKINFEMPVIVYYS